MPLSKSSFNPLVSVIIPVYNGANYVGEAIDSVLAQTYKNIEIVVVNDGSTDETDSVLKKYGKKIKYFKKKNGGVSTALNLAIKKSKGKYISWLSHDDLYTANKIEVQVDALARLEKRDSTIIYSNYSLINEYSKKIVDFNFEREHPLSKLEYPLYPLLNGLINGCTMLIPKRCYVECGTFDVNLRAAQDYDLWYRMFQKYEIRFLTTQLVYTRIHDQQGTKTIPTVDVEGSQLWIKMIEGLSKEQKIRIGGSVIEFYEKAYRMLTGSRYTDAREYLLKLIDTYKQRNLTQIKVSVIIPFYNRTESVLKAINSVAKQSHKNIELIVVNDCSTEDVKTVVQVCRKNGYKYYRNVKNYGPAKSRNIALKHVTGEFVAFLDSDDLFKQQKISKQLEFMVTNGYAFSHTSYQTINELTGKTEVVRSGRIDFTYPQIISYCGIATPTVMISRDLLLENRELFPEKYIVGEDVCAWISLSRDRSLNGLDEIQTVVIKNNENANENIHLRIEGINNIYNFVTTGYANPNALAHLRRLHRMMGRNLTELINLERKRRLDYYLNKIRLLFEKIFPKSDKYR